MSGTSFTDKFPSGSWGYGPLSITWSLKAGNEVDVAVSVLGINVDNASGTIKDGAAVIDDTLNVLGIVKGDIKIEAVHGKGPAEDGIWLDVVLNGIIPQTRTRIVTW